MNNSSTSSPATRIHLLILGLAFVVAVTSVVGCGSQTNPPKAPNVDQAEESTRPKKPSAEQSANTSAESSPTRDEIIAKSDELIAKRDYEAAAAELRKLLLVDPNDIDVLFALAGLEANAGRLQTAVDLLGEIPEDHPEAGLPSLGQSADWYFELQQYDKAEQRYRKILTRAPQAAPALRQLAYLLNRQGRRHEAAQYVFELCKLGNVRQDELHSLLALSDAMYDEPSEETSAGENPYWPIGPSGAARKLFNDEKFQEAVSLLHPSVADRTAAPAIVALYGRAAAEAQDVTSFHWWLTQTDDRAREFAEYWAALGTHLLSQQRFEEAARALAEAISRDPTDLRSLARLRQVFLVMDDDATAQRFTDRWTEIRESLRVNNRIASASPPDPNAIAELASLLQALNRPLESVLWKAFEQHYRQSPQAERLELNKQRQQLVAAGKLSPSPSERLCGLDLTKYPLPKINAPVRSAATPLKTNAAQPNVKRPTRANFENIATRIGLHHTYRVASEPVPHGFSVYQMLGGGVVVLDYDLDGQSDLYFAQGGADPPEFHSERTNQFFRNAGSVLVEVTDSSSAAEYQYTIGMTAGDWNQDGFPDLVVANIGIDMLLINNGDGTFARRPITAKANTNRIPSSAAMADLTGDGLPDIFQASYVDDPRRVMKPPTNDKGQPLQPILPSKFRPGADKLVVNDGAGNFSIGRLTPDASDDATSLGLIVTNFDGKGGNEIFVGNDLKPNQLWVRSETQSWADVAPVRGCAFSFTGAATASMGVAAGDFENNGTLDLHITNYQDENSSLFLAEGGMFQDLNIQYRIASDSRAVLGFGTQTIDYDNDGKRDLVVTNGHIDDAVDNTAPLRQPPQLFGNLGGQFQIADVDDSSNYWSSNHVGRGLATLDFDRNGTSDFVVTHIEQPSALLLNKTPTDNHWLQLKLVGTSSERDSIGARIHLRYGQQESTDWVIAGDGYLSNNEDIICFGLGETAKIDELTIDWSSGNQQIFNNIQANQRLLILENEDAPYTLFAAP